MTTVCIVQARIASSRFRGKVLAGILWRPMLAHVVERAQAIPGVDEVVLCLPDHDKEEERLVWWGAQLGVATYRNQARMPNGANDVLGAYLKTAQATKADVIVRVTADCPLLAPEIAGDVVERVTSGRVLFASNCRPVRTYPDGLDVEAFTVGMLETAALGQAPSEDREHVTPGIARLAWHPEAAWEEAHGSVQHHEDLSAVRWTVDVPEDLLRIRAIYSYLPEGEYSMAASVAAAKDAGQWP